MSDPERLILTALAHRCADQSELFFRRQASDPRFCYELFRRAILDCNRDAWDLVYTQYRRLVAGWVVRHPAFPTAGEDADYYINRAFEKMWSALTPEKFSHFPDLKSLLRYLQMCVHSVIMDSMRSAASLGAGASLAEEAGRSAPGPGTEEEALARVQHEQLWDCIRSRLHDDKERSVIYGSFVLDLKPQELLSVYRDTFRSVDEVYRVKQNVLDRLRRDAEIARFLNAR